MTARPVTPGDVPSLTPTEWSRRGRALLRVKIPEVRKALDITGYHASVGGTRCRVRVVCVETGERFRSILAAQHWLQGRGCNTDLWYALRRGKTAGGFHWRQA